MPKKSSMWVVLPLIVLGGALVACSTTSTETQGISIEADNSADVQLPSQAETSQIVAGELGKRLDDYILQDKPLFSGSILVAQEGEILLSKGYNFSNWELKSPNSALTKYRISSITKPFTATMIMMLAENGLLNLDHPLCSYVPDCPDAWQDINIQHLLTHTSGIPDYTSMPGANEESRDPHNVSTLIDKFRDEELEFSPGATHRYSNSNYVMLGVVIEQASGNRYDKFLEKAILKPLEIEDTGIDYNSQVLTDRAAGYQIQGRALLNAPYLDMSNAFATADMYSTVGDLFAFDQALNNGLLLNPQNQEIMYTPTFAADGSGGSYGFGWQLIETDGHRRVGHSGGINGFRVFLGRYLDDKVTIILLSNIETEDIDQVVEGLEEIVFNQN